nr:hypothetical protein [Spirochaetaceae bacterium]
MKKYLVIIFSISCQIFAQESWIGWNLGTLSIEQQISKGEPNISLKLMEFTLFDEYSRFGLRIGAMEFPQIFE